MPEEPYLAHLSGFHRSNSTKDQKTYRFQLTIGPGISFVFRSKDRTLTCYFFLK